MDQMTGKPAAGSRPTVDAPIIPITRRRFIQGFATAAALSSAVLMVACQSPAATPSVPTAPAGAAPTATSPAPTTAATAAPATAASGSPTVASVTATPAVAPTPSVVAPAATPAAVATTSPAAAPTVAPAAQAEVVAGKPMYQVDPSHTGRSPHTGPTHGVALRTFDLAHSPVPTGRPASPRVDIQSSSVIAPDGTIYIADFPGNLFALRDPGQGSSLNFVWLFHPAGGTSAHATPALGHDGSVYLGFSVGRGNAARTTFYALKAPASGTEAQVAWSVDFGEGQMTSSPTVGPDGTIYAVSGPGKLYAIAPDGTVKWTAQTGPTLRSTPALGADGAVYQPSTDGKLYTVLPPASADSKEGIVSWTFDFGQHLGKTPLLTKAGGFGGGSGIGSGASPTIGPDRTIYIGANNSNFYAINPDGSLKWLYEAERELAGIWATAALSADATTLFFGANKGGIYALNTLDGSLRWQFPIYGSVYSSPALDHQGTLYTGSTIGHVYALDSTSGHVVFDYDAGAQVWSAPSILPNGTVFIADRKGRAVLLGDG